MRIIYLKFYLLNLITPAVKVLFSLTEKALLPPPHTHTNIHTIIWLCAKKNGQFIKFQNKQCLWLALVDGKHLFISFHFNIQITC